MQVLDEPIVQAEKPIQEFEVDPRPGLIYLIGYLALLVASSLGLIAGVANEYGPLVVGALVGIVGAIVGLTGLFTVNPNEAKVLQLFGEYKGTVRTPGLRWVNPFYSKKPISTRVRNFESGQLKVNDRNGNPIEIAAVVVWRVVDTAEALFHVDAYEDFVHVQSEAALRSLATGYAYDAPIDDDLSLRGNTAEVAEHLRNEIQDRLFKAGVDVIEARISHLAYAPEIAGAMLQRQQADAIIAARAKIVEGAVGMVEMALGMLDAQKLVELDNEKKALMVSNLLVVLCSDRGTQPIVSTNSGQGRHH
jgi:regulator of protease activity HflC (stomatin/prohibitin superfamily)